MEIRDKIIEDGQIVEFSAIGEFSFSYGYGEDKTGVCIVLDGEVYTCLEDPDDGYRSYGSFGKGYVDFGNAEVHPKVWTRIPNQKLKVVWEEVDEDTDDYWHNNYWKMKLVNPDTELSVLEIGTDYSEDYYPTCIYYYDPTNLPINAGVL